jgi:hypothetical protein
MSSCSSTIYPPAVIASVQKQMGDVVVQKEIPEALQLKPSMRQANLQDVVVGWLLGAQCCLKMYIGFC